MGCQSVDFTIYCWLFGNSNHIYCFLCSRSPANYNLQLTIWNVKAQFFNFTKLFSYFIFWPLGFTMKNHYQFISKLTFIWLHIVLALLLATLFLKKTKLKFIFWFHSHFGSSQSSAVYLFLYQQYFGTWALNGVKFLQDFTLVFIDFFGLCSCLGLYLLVFPAEEVELIHLLS